MDGAAIVGVIPDHRLHFQQFHHRAAARERSQPFQQRQLFHWIELQLLRQRVDEVLVGHRLREPVGEAAGEQWRQQVLQLATFAAQLIAIVGAHPFVDRRDQPLRTLQDFLSGKANYVSVAMDSKAFPYGTKLRIPELEAKYGKQIEFRVVDTGGAFVGKGTSRIDICTANKRASLDSVINGPLTLVRS